MQTACKLLRVFHIFISVAQKSKSGLGRHVLRFINRNFAHTLGSTPMSEWSALRRGLYPHNTQQTRRTPKPSEGFETAITVTKRPQP